MEVESNSAPDKTRRRGRPRNLRREPSVFETVAARARNQVPAQELVGNKGRGDRERGKN